MKLNFTSLQYFQKTAELEHLTKAAEELHIAQPALSRTIRGLEQELEVTLFEHQGRNIRLTRDGHILLKHAQNFLKEFDEMQQEFKDSRDLAQSTVKLAILSATQMIPTFLMQFQEGASDGDLGNPASGLAAGGRQAGSFPLCGSANDR